MAGIYVHIPFCRRKCEYCAFISFANGEVLQTEYTDMLIKEAKARAEKNRALVFDTLFFGGGTPSLLKKELFEKIVSVLREEYDLSALKEFTCEANPDSISKELLDFWMSCGVNRLSIGVQSFNDKELGAIGRVHDSKKAIEAIKLAKEAGFENISVDLMCALPFQTKETLINSIKTAVSLEVKHISCYQLQIEEGTVLYKKYESGQYLEPTDEEYIDSMHAADDLLQSCGFSRYEVSNFALPGYECRHNMNYWERGDYVGLGVAAHSLEGNARIGNTECISEYMRGNFEASRDIIDAEEAAEEELMLMLRTSKGAPLALIPSEKLSMLKASEKAGLVKITDKSVIATQTGFDVLNQLIINLLPD